ncbi:MAG: VacJ family lipoprotein [Duodenibacillus sp.]|nr:VacJ family lipoprotein [Duodenibacillus sp.]
MFKLRAKGALLGLAAALALAGCAQIPEGAGSDPHDPWEKMNRNTFAFNQKFDSLVLRPIAKGYQWAVPQVMRDSVGNVFVNLGEPSNILNNALQGKGEGALASLFRLMINTTLGVGGLFDVAGKAGNQPERAEDFGQTLAVWGVGSGPYFVIPFVGPSSVRDASGLVVDYFSEPMTYADEGAVEWGLWGLKVVDLRERLLPATDLLKGAVDPYLMAREAYLANRQNAVYDGNPPLESLEDMFPEDPAEAEEAGEVEGEAADDAAAAK